MASYEYRENAWDCLFWGIVVSLGLYLFGHLVFG